MRFKLSATLAAAVLFALHLSVPGTAHAEAAVTSEEAHEIAVDAYIYFYPLVTMDITRRQMTNAEPGKVSGFGPMDMFSNMAAYPTADLKAVVRPNFDT